MSKTPETPAPARVATQMLGGLGNQLFQYAAGRALARRLGARLLLDCTAISGATRRFVLDRYPIDAEIVRDAPGKLHRRHFRLPGVLGRRLTDAFHDHVPTTHEIGGHRFKVFGEKRWFTYDPYFEKLGGSIYLTGYWQSYRYFEEAADLIRGEIRPAWPLSDANQAWLARIEATNAVCLHVRRGDYLDHKGGSPLVCARSYYDDALQHVRRSLQEPQIFVFSDDIAMVPGNLCCIGFRVRGQQRRGRRRRRSPPDGGLPPSHHRQFVAELVGRLACSTSGTGRDRAAALAAWRVLGSRPASRALDQAATGVVPHQASRWA